MKNMNLKTKSNLKKMTLNHSILVPTHCRVITEVDQEKGKCPNDKFDPMSNWPKAQDETRAKDLE